MIFINISNILNLIFQQSCNARFLAKKTIEELAGGSKQIDFDYVKDHVTDAVARLLFQETAKRPIVIPVILSV